MERKDGKRIGRGSRQGAGAARAGRREMKFIHIADVHLGAKPDKGKPWARERETHSWRAFVDVINRAKEEQAQLLLIAGDLFHGQPLLWQLEQVNAQFSRIMDTQVVLIAGNRDYLGPQSFYHTFQWGENVSFLKDENICMLELGQLRVRVYGQSYWHKEITRNIYQGIQAQDDGYFNILLAHGGDERHIPFRIRDLTGAGFDYAALGHIHKPMQHIHGRAVMAGALQPIDCSDMGEHGYFLGEIEGGRCSVEFCPLHYCEYVPLNLKLTGNITEKALGEYVEGRIAQSPPYQIFKVTLTGPGKFGEVDGRSLERIGRVAQVVNRCQAEFDLEGLKLRYGDQLIGKYISELEKRPQDEIAKRALNYGVEALISE